MNSGIQEVKELGWRKQGRHGNSLHWASAMRDLLDVNARDT